MRILKSCTALILSTVLLFGTFGVPAKAAGVTLSGTITTGTTGVTTLSLIPEGQTSPIETRHVKDGKFGILNLEQGVYTLKAENSQCGSRSYSITIGEEAVEQEMKLCRMGDVTQDGKINVVDTAKVYAHVRKSTLIADAYTLACADLNGDGNVNVVDTARLYSQIRNAQPEPTPKPEPNYPVTGNPVVDNPDEPIEVGSVLEFDIPLQAGHLAHYWVYRVSDTTLTIQDPNVYVIYNGVTYTPKDGVLTIPGLHTDSIQKPVEMDIGNKGDVDKVFTAVLTYPQGHQMNPYPMANGNLTTVCEEGNSQGVFYSFTAPSDGTITVKIRSVTGAEKCSVSLTSDILIGGTRAESTDDNDSDAVSMTLTAGETVIVNIVVTPENGFNYPAATIVTQVRFR